MTTMKVTFNGADLTKYLDQGAQQAMSAALAQWQEELLRDCKPWTLTFNGPWAPADVPDEIADLLAPPVHRTLPCGPRALHRRRRPNRVGCRGRSQR